NRFLFSFLKRDSPEQISSSRQRSHIYLFHEYSSAVHPLPRQFASEEILLSRGCISHRKWYPMFLLNKKAYRATIHLPLRLQSDLYIFEDPHSPEQEHAF